MLNLSPPGTTSLSQLYCISLSYYLSCGCPCRLVIQQNVCFTTSPRKLLAFWTLLAQNFGPCVKHVQRGSQYTNLGRGGAILQDHMQYEMITVYHAALLNGGQHQYFLNCMMVEVTSLLYSQHISLSCIYP